MKTNQHYIVCWILLLVLVTATTNAQEVLTPLNYNPVLLDYQQNKPSSTVQPNSNKTASALSLPFLDDFGYESPYPRGDMWEDSLVYINNTYARAPISIGVATFDGLNKKGLPYDIKVGAATSRSADTLTSKVLSLRRQDPSTDEEVWFSFYYQAKGNGNPPDKKDSLFVEFMDSTANAWKWVWSAPGYTPANNDSSFRRAMIPITDLAFLTNGFRFRIRNYATVSGNFDHWNIDMVYLNKNRSINDTVWKRAKFVYRAFPLLKKYREVPYDHYNPTLMESKGSIAIRNNGDVPRAIKYGYEVFDYNNASIYKYPEFVYQVPIYIPNGYLKDAGAATPAIGFDCGTTLTDTCTFREEHSLVDGPDIDTMKYYQRFNDCYALDDGTAESAYGVSDQWSQFAMKFDVYKSDTLKAMDVYFAQMEKLANDIPFRMAIWENDGNKPGKLLYKDSVNFVTYQNAVNKFTRINFTGDGCVLNAGTYYMGWIQISAGLLNIGMDLNTDNQWNSFYNTKAVWINTTYKGTVMLRPVFPKSFPLGVEENIKTAMDIQIYPNPAQGNIYIDYSQKSKGDGRVLVMDMTGRLVANYPLTTSFINISALDNGTYLFQIQDGQLFSTVHKVVVNN